MERLKEGALALRHHGTTVIATVYATDYNALLRKLESVIPVFSHLREGSSIPVSFPAWIIVERLPWSYEGPWIYLFDRDPKGRAEPFEKRILTLGKESQKFVINIVVPDPEVLEMKILKAADEFYRSVVGQIGFTGRAFLEVYSGEENDPAA